MSSVEQVRELRKIRQRRDFTSESVSDDLLNEFLEVARWSGSGRNTQPWHFVVIRDKETLAKLGALRENITWMENAPMAIAIIVDHDDASFDEGRVTERLLIAAHLLGLGAGTAWWGEPENVAEAKRILGVPDGKIFNSAVVIGHPKPGGDDLLGRTAVGRKSLSEIVSYEKYGSK